MPKIPALTPHIIGLWGLTLLLTAACAHAAPTCYGPYANGRRPTPEALARVLNAHDVWRHNPQRADAQRANLCGADLRSLDLSRMNLAQVNLQGALLNRASLQQANLRRADLRQADIEFALLGHADLRGAMLFQTNLRGVYLFRANLQNTSLRQVNLRDASLLAANLQDARISRSDLRRAAIKEADLRRSHISHSDLSQADLKGADLRRATLMEVRLSRANLGAAHLADMVFEPSPNFLPEIRHLSLVHGLSQLTFHSSPRSLIALRDVFEQAGEVRSGRDLTYAINRGLRQRADPLQAALSFVFFELTCLYGLAPARPLWLLLVWTISLTLPYAIGLKGDDPISVMDRDGRWHWLQLVLQGFLFSALVLITFGHRNGCLRPVSSRWQQQKRWMRGVIGLQYLVSLYLLLLWGFTAYGRPFV